MKNEKGAAADVVRVEAAVKLFRQGASEIRALDGLDLAIAAGEFVAIMGASGSGKSTLLHAIAGLSSLDGGKVTVEERDLADFSDAALTRFRRERIGLVFQAFNLIPTLNAEDNIRLPGLHRDDLDKRVADLLARLGLEERRHHRPDALSGGEQQRVAIARALVGEPAILLADEPTGSLDSVAGESLCRLLRQLCDEDRRTIAVVTHEPAVALWADRIVVLKDGRCVAEFAPPEDRDPQTMVQRYQRALQTEANR